MSSDPLPLEMPIEIPFILFITLGICKSASGCFESIISFGDSYADTGNYPLLCPPDTPPTCARPPYGRTFFDCPTGRSSDGRLVIDFIDGRKFLQKSLVVMGEIGGNDFNHPIQQGSSLDVLQSLVPPVIGFIGSAIKELIELGVETLLVPGNPPFGCAPVYLAQFKASSTASDYNPETGCLNWLNAFVMHYNEFLLKELNRLQELYPHANIIYADYYNNALRFYLSPNELGFGEGNLLRSCCGSGGPYNYNKTARCGVPPATSCHDPPSFVSWDGIHLTEAAYRLIAQGLLDGSYTTPQMTTICPSISGVTQLYEY